jgi:dihydroorotase-like cyclic amidohydrolase
MESKKDMTSGTSAAIAGGVTMVLGMIHEVPWRIYDLPGRPDAWTEVDLDAHYALSAEDLYTRCGWTPLRITTRRGG